jgi:hypothetical protein
VGRKKTLTLAFLIFPLFPKVGKQSLDIYIANGCILISIGDSLEKLELLMK